ncbi:S8 family serine peptidase [Haladaptatus sp. DYF46]|uniref:S8 family serine peptidase n=1 Tax=Haladaptatus sp. DYF46 TaxID=2886041 RepID=UPI001E4E43C9|nr:S8 family serine peptidase [Haladaptatus sp. DYF46]
MADDNTSRFDRRTFLKTTGAIGATAALSGVTVATPGRSPGPKEDEILVGVSAGYGDIEQAVTQSAPMDVNVVHKNEHLRYVAVKLSSAMPDSARQSFMDAIEQRDGIKYAEENATHESLLTPNDPKFGQQYAPQMVHSDDAWDTTLGSSDVTVAVIDTGAQYDHPDLAANYKSNPGRDFADDDSDPYPDAPQDEYHATHVSGIAAGVIDNGTGVAGQGNSSLINGRALDEDGSGSTSDIADAIRWAADQGADVINMSLGGGGYTSTMKNAVTYASNNGVFIAAAAGNNGSSSVSYPAGYSECLAVSAIDSNGNLASFSQYGSKVELCAPGVDILSTTTEARGSYEKLSGTSMATPVVAGVAGLTLSQWDLTNSELRSHLKNTAVDVGLSSNKQGSGRVDSYNAVTTQPGSGGGDGGDGGDGGSGSTSDSVSGSLSSYADYADYSWSWEYSNPSQIVVELDGPSGADFDLYLNTGATSAASPSNYDYSSTSTNSQETVTIDSPDTSTDLQIDVDSYSGSGSYTVTITEFQ